MRYERPMRRLSIEALIDKFPDFRVAFVLAEPLTVAPARSAALAEDIAAAEAECRTRWGATELSAIPGVAAWRSAYQGIRDQEDELPLVGRAADQAGAGRPSRCREINALVDLYNLVSLDERALPRLRRSRQDRGRPRLPLLAVRTTRSSTWARRRARTRTIRPRTARWSTPTRATCSAGAGTGARTRALPSTPKRHGAPC